MRRMMLAAALILTTGGCGDQVGTASQVRPLGAGRPVTTPAVRQVHPTPDEQVQLRQQRRRAERFMVRKALPTLKARVTHKPKPTHAIQTSVPPRTVNPKPTTERYLGIQRVTRYCWTGSQTANSHWPVIGIVAVLDRSIPFGSVIKIDGLGSYVVDDWIGHGSDFDIYSGRAGCETRAANFGRIHRKIWMVHRG